jgi:chromosome segregation ATPase
MDLWQRMLRAGARSVCLPAPTVLHFRAWERDQTEADRIRQTHAFAARLRDPRERAAVRAEMNAALQAEVSRWEEAATKLSMEIQVTRAAADTARADAAQAHAALADAHTALAQAHGALADVQAENERLGAEAAMATATLERIYAGGWWRLRGRIQPALRVARRLADRYGR